MLAEPGLQPNNKCILGLYSRYHLLLRGAAALFSLRQVPSQQVRIARSLHLVCARGIWIVVAKVVISQNGQPRNLSCYDYDGRDGRTCSVTAWCSGLPGSFVP